MAFGEEVPRLKIPKDWNPTHKQNGKTVSAEVRVIGVVERSFKDPKTERQVFQSKALILVRKGKKYVPSRVQAYLYSSKSLNNNTDFRIVGELSILDSQVKGGSYPATIRINESELLPRLKPENKKATEPKNSFADLKTLTGLHGFVLDVAFRPDRKTIASGSIDSTLKLRYVSVQSVK